MCIVHLLKKQTNKKKSINLLNLVVTLFWTVVLLTNNVPQSNSAKRQDVFYKIWSLLYGVHNSSYCSNIVRFLHEWKGHTEDTRSKQLSYSQQWSGCGENVMNCVSCCLFLLFCITPKLLYIFSIAWLFFSCVWVCNIVQLLLNQENMSFFWEFRCTCWGSAGFFSFALGISGALGIRISCTEAVSKNSLKLGDSRWCI